MMALARELGREEAHAIVTAASRKARAADRELLEVLVEDPRAGSLIDSALLTRLRDPAAYLGLAVDVATTVGRGESDGGLPAIEPEAAPEEA
jgi:3-carboxy-cis,cis-muconate cycloisomerase